MGSNPRGNAELRGIFDEVVHVPKITPDRILEDAVFAAAPWMSREEVRVFVKKPHPKTIPTREEKRKVMEADLMKDAVAVANKLVVRLLKEQRDSTDGVTVPQISGLRTFRQGNYTVVLLNDQFVGVSKRNKADKFNQNTGVRKALYRAVRRLVIASQR